MREIIKIRENSEDQATNQPVTYEFGIGGKFKCYKTKLRLCKPSFKSEILRFDS